MTRLPIFIYILFIFSLLMSVGCTRLSTGNAVNIYQEIEALEDEIFQLRDDAV